MISQQHCSCMFFVKDGRRKQDCGSSPAEGFSQSRAVEDFRAESDEEKWEPSSLTGGTLRSWLEATSCTFFAVSSGREVDTTKAVAAAIDHLPAQRRAGCVRISDDVVVWRRAALLELLETGLPRENLLEVLRKAERLYAVAVDGAPFVHGTVALLVSRWGGTKFGGAEHTLRQFAAVYESRGFRSILAGTRAGTWGR